MPLARLAYLIKALRHINMAIMTRFICPSTKKVIEKYELVGKRHIKQFVNGRII